MSAELDAGIRDLERVAVPRAGAGSHEIALELPPEEALRAVGRVAEIWGGEWRPDAWGGRLVLPVQAGLRVGVVRGHLGIESRAGGGSDLRFVVEDRHFVVQRPAVAVLTVGALGASSTVLWPFFPVLLGLAPAGWALAVLAWLLVVSRLRSRGEGEFLAMVGDGGDGKPSGNPPPAAGV